MVGSDFCVSVVCSSLTFSQCGGGRLSLVLPDNSPDLISEFGVQVLWGFPEDVGILSCIKVKLFLLILPAGEYDRQAKSMGKTGFVVNTPTSPVSTVREISHHETGATDFGNNLIVNLVIANEAIAIRDRARQAIEKWGICCLSKVRDNILMWSHYAKAHHGFCLEFSNELHIAPNVYQSDIGEIAPFPVVPLEVKYSEEYPVFNPVSPDGSANKTLLTKATQWEYESEWRMALPRMTGSYQFLPDCLTGVIFGCRMSEEHKKMIRNWCKDRQPAITYYEARESEDSYSLNVVEIPCKQTEKVLAEKLQ